MELKKSCAVEERYINFYQQERERLNYIWMLQKKKIEDTNSDFLNITREKEDLSEQHMIEKKLYMQRIKYTMLKQQDENVELIKQAEISLKQLEDMHRVKEKDFKYDKRSLSRMKKEQEVLQNDFIHALQKENIKKIHDLKNEYEQRENQLRSFYRERMKELRNNMEEKRKKQIQDINAKKLKEIKNETEEHAKFFNNMKNYYADLNKKNLTRLKTLAKDFGRELKERVRLKGKKANKMMQKKKIEEPLKKLKETIIEKTEEADICKKNNDKLHKINEEYKRLMKELLDFEYKYEVTLQKVSFLEKEKDSYMNKYKGELHSVEQKAGLRVLLINLESHTGEKIGEC